MRILPALLAVSALLAQDDLPERTFTATVSRVLVPVTIVGKGGEFIAGLEPKDFRLYDNGKLQNIAVDISYQPISLVVLVQASGNTDSVLPKIQKIAPLLSGLVVGEAGEVAIVSFDHRFEVRQDFTSDSDLLKQGLAKILAGSDNVTVKDAVRNAVRMLARRPQNRRKVILLISETRDRGSEARTREVLAEVQLHNISVYTVNINRLVSTLMAKTPVPRPDPVPTTARHLPGVSPTTPTAVMQQGYGSATNVVPLFVEIFRDVKDIFVSNPSEVFTRFTGGREYSFLDQSSLERAITDIGAELHSQFLITYDPDNKEEGGFHEIRVEVAKPEARDWTIRHRAGYWMAAMP
jgi:VWFA-related protein